VNEWAFGSTSNRITTQAAKYEQYFKEPECGWNVSLRILDHAIELQPNAATIEMMS